MKCNCTDAPLLKPELIEYLTEMTDITDIKGNLITVLQKTQDIYGYLPVDVLVYISKYTGIKLAKIMGVVTFYTQFRTKPVGKYLILICQGTACHVNGSNDIESAVKDYLKVGEGEITQNGLFTYNNVACLGCCSLAPAIMIGDRTYGNLTKDSVVKVLEKIGKGEI